MKSDDFNPRLNPHNKNEEKQLSLNQILSANKQVSKQLTKDVFSSFELE